MGQLEKFVGLMIDHDITKITLNIFQSELIHKNDPIFQWLLGIIEEVHCPFYNTPGKLKTINRNNTPEWPTEEILKCHSITPVTCESFITIYFRNGTWYVKVNGQIKYDSLKGTTTRNKNI